MPMTRVPLRTGANISEAEGRDLSPIAAPSGVRLTGASRKINSAPSFITRRVRVVGFRSIVDGGMSRFRPSIVSMLKIGTILSSSGE